MDKAIADFVQCKRIAVVGVSRDSKKFGNAIYQELAARGYEVYGVNPAVQEIAGKPCYPDLTALKGKIDGVVVCVKPGNATGVLREAAQIGLQHVWLQSGCASAEVEKAAQTFGLTPVVGKCILMYAEPVRSLHAFHRFFAKAFGQL